MQPDHEVDLAPQQFDQQPPPAISPVCDQDFARAQEAEQLAGKRQFVILPGALYKGEEAARVQAKQADEFAGGKPAAWFLSSGIGPAPAVIPGIRLEKPVPSITRTVRPRH